MFFSFSISTPLSIVLLSFLYLRSLLIIIYCKKKEIKLAHSPINSIPAFGSPPEFAFSSITIFSSSTFRPCNPPTILKLRASIKVKIILERFCLLLLTISSKLFKVSLKCSLASVTFSLFAIVVIVSLIPLTPCLVTFLISSFVGKLLLLTLPAILFLKPSIPLLVTFLICSSAGLLFL